MSEFHQLQADTQNKKGQPSWYDRLVPGMDADRRSSLDDALADPTVFHTTISRVLANWDLKVSPTQVRQYRRVYLGI